jgi:hypothetical protein
VRKFPFALIIALISVGLGAQSTSVPPNGTAPSDRPILTPEQQKAKEKVSKEQLKKAATKAKKDQKKAEKEYKDAAKSTEEKK